jgi:Velvet factor
MMTDFDPESALDLSELKSNHYVVHCKLISAESPRMDVTTHTTVSEDGSRETSRLLLGTNVASPFFCADDPDLPNMPQHPRSERETEPDSPSSRFFPGRRASPPGPTASADPPRSLPAAFFIFADLSVRRAGNYRLEFTLMKIDPAAMNLPMIHVAASQVFKVVNAKDFDQVHPSTRLVRGLLERGAPFPLKLKKGIREGQRRRGNLGEGEEGGEGSVEGSLVGGDEPEEGE